MLRSIFVAVACLAQFEQSYSLLALKTPMHGSLIHPFVEKSCVSLPPLRLKGGANLEEIPKKVKLTYFNIEGAAEKIRLALKIGGIPFEDERIDFGVWQRELKGKSKFGQLPLLTLDDKPPVAQSFAILRYVGRISGLYPSDPLKAMYVDEACALQEDLRAALAPSVYIEMKPHLLGYPENLPDEEKKSIQKRLRNALVADGGDGRRYLGYFERYLEGSPGDFLCGDSVTIADCTLLPALRQFKSGKLEGVPTTIIDEYPLLAAYYDRMMSLPAVKSHYT